jgi:hypothetical protein
MHQENVAMRQLSVFAIILISFLSCNQAQPEVPAEPGQHFIPSSTLISIESTTEEALLLTRFKSLDELESKVLITYTGGQHDAAGAKKSKPQVTLLHRGGGKEVISILQSGISESDFIKARNGTLWDRVKLAFRCPYAVINRADLRRIESLGRRRPWEFGKGDVAFYDLAEAMVENISNEDSLLMSAEELSEKGYLNTFNHITAQAFMTTIFSETMADFVADVHERYNMPQLISGVFTEGQRTDMKDGPADNYLDMINNEWGQELGKELGLKHSIHHDTFWTPALMMDYLNDIQSYYSWVFHIGFKPFRKSDDRVIRFAEKINRVMG